MDDLSSEYIQIQRTCQTFKVKCQHLDIGDTAAHERRVTWHGYGKDILEIGRFRTFGLAIVPSVRFTNEHFSNNIETQKSILEYRTADQDQARSRSIVDLWDPDAPADLRKSYRTCQTRL